MPGTFSTNDGGQVVLESDGDFTYTPAAATSCTDLSDFFDYTVTDGNTPTPGTDIGRVTIAVAGCVWYVSNNAAGNAGTSTAPFDTLGQAEAASSAGHTIYLYDGDDTTLGYAAGIDLKANQRLIGEVADLVVGGATLTTGTAGNRPTITDSNTDVVALASGNTIRGVQLDPQGTGGGIAGAAGDASGTIDDVRVVDTGTPGAQPAVELDATTGTFEISNLTVDNSTASAPPSTATGVRLNNAGTVSFAAAGTVSIRTAGARGLDAAGTNLGTGSVLDDITVTGSSNGAVSMVNTSGTTTFGALSLTTTSGPAAAFALSNAGSVTVSAAGTANVSATGGPAVDVTATTNPTLAFDDVDSTNSSADGINLDGLGAGTFSATSGDIAGATGISFDLNGGSGAVTYPGNLANGAGAIAVDVTGRTGGAVTLSGRLLDTNDAGGAINVSGNSGGSTALSGGTKQANTGSANAVTFTSSDGHTLTLSGGGLDIDATSGNGLDATTSGTLNVTGTGNTIVTTTGRALRVQDTDVGGTPLTFQSVSANGAPTGILLSNTGASPSLTVTGDGGTCTNANTSGCTGGVIQSTTGADSTSSTPTGTGIVLNNTVAPSFTRMHLLNHANYAIRGTGVTGFTLANSVINGTNGTNGATGDSSVYFHNDAGSALVGSASVTNTHVQGGLEDNFRVSQTSGSLNRLTFDGVTIGANNTSFGNDGIVVEGTGTATVNVTVQNSSLTSSRGDLFQMIADGTGGGDLNFYGNTLSNNHPGISTGGGGVSLMGGANGTFNVDVDGVNTFRDAVGTALLIVKSIGSGSMNAVVDGATIGQAAAANSGSLEGSGIKVQHAGGGTMTVAVTNSTFRQYNNFGIELQAGAGVASPGTFNLTVTGNTVANPGTNGAIGNPFQGIALNNGVTPAGVNGDTANGDSFQTCLHLASNTAGSSGRNGGHDLRVRQRMNTTVRLPGYAGGASDTAAVASFLLGQNSAVTASAVRESSNVPSGGGFVGGASCALPVVGP